MKEALAEFANNKVVRAFINIALCLLMLFSLLVLAVTLLAPRGEDGASNIFGYELRLVESDSMAAHPDTDVSAYEIKSFKKNTVIAVDRVPNDLAAAKEWYSTVAVGDVLTVRYTYDRQVTITHRVSSVEPKEDGSGYIIKLVGDNLESDTALLVQEIDTSDISSTNYVIGRVVWTSYFFGTIIGGCQRVLKAFAAD